MNKSDSAYKTIGEVAKILNFKLNEKGVLPTYIIRFWEKQFKQIKPVIFNNRRRYYDKDTVDLLMRIKYLLKDKGMTIKGVKIELKNNDSELDEIDNKTINKKNIKIKLSKISNIIKSIKSNG